MSQDWSIETSGDGMSCIDIDECNVGDHKCNKNAACSNNFGSYTCVCNIGYNGIEQHIMSH